MRLEPVYLLAPPEKPPTWSRRAVIAGAALAFGLGLGLAALVTRRRAAPPAPDAELAWALALADGPIAALVAYRHAVFEIGARRSTELERLEPVFVRLADHALDTSSADEQRMVIARELVALLQRPEAIRMPTLGERATALRRLAR